MSRYQNSTADWDKEEGILEWAVADGVPQPLSTLSIYVYSQIDSYMAIVIISLLWLYTTMPLDTYQNSTADWNKEEGILAWAVAVGVPLQTRLPTSLNPNSSPKHLHPKPKHCTPRTLNLKRDFRTQQSTSVPTHPLPEPQPLS